jgi:hypothetical protein
LARSDKPIATRAALIARPKYPPANESAFDQVNFPLRALVS